MTATPAQIMLTTALQMEQKGQSFYEKAIDQCATTLGKDIFTMLRNDEGVHIERIQTIYTRLQQGEPTWDDAWKTLVTGHDDLTGLFRDMARKHGPEVQSAAEDIKALQIGIDFEAAAVAFYQDHLARATDPIEREFTQHMIREEKDHHAALMDMQHYLNNPEDWFLEQEHGGLDGA